MAHARAGTRVAVAVAVGVGVLVIGVASDKKHDDRFFCCACWLKTCHCHNLNHESQPSPDCDVRVNV